MAGVVMNAVTGVQHSGQRALEAIQTTVEDVKDSSAAMYQGLADSFSSRKHEYKEFMEKYLKIKLRKKLLQWVDLIPDFIKQQIEDPYMPRFVKRLAHKSIDTVWPDVKVELVWDLQVLLDEDEEHYQEKLEEGGKPDCIRAFLRYRLFPYNRSTWQCLRDPVFVIVNILALIPYMGIYAWMYAFIWVIIDKTDEYQLIYYILSFKGAQFFSWGVLKGFVGFTQYFRCTTFPPIDQFANVDLTQLTSLQISQRTQSSCAVNGPGMSEQYWVSIMSWLLPLVLVWISLFILPFSKEKGRTDLKTFHDQKTMQDIEGADVVNTNTSTKSAKSQTQGGYLRRMCIFDFAIFLICVGLMAMIIALQPDTTHRSKWAAFYHAQDSDWQVKQTLFFCQFLYGLCSIVFVPFVLPLLQAILTHSAPTAYNEDGQCCKFKGPEKPKKALSPEEEDDAAKINEEENEGIVSNLSNIANGKSFNMDALRNRLGGGAAGGAAAADSAAQGSAAKAAPVEEV